MNATVGGASSGTLLLSLAQQFGQHSLVGQMLIYLSPSFAVVSGAWLIALKSQMNIWYERWLVRVARKTLEGKIRDSSTLEQDKNAFRELLGELHRSQALSAVNRARDAGK